MNIEVVSEPTPTPRATGRRMTGASVGCKIHLVEESTGKQVSEIITPDYVCENERRTREERKY